MRGARAHKACEQRKLDSAEGSSRKVAAFCLF